MADSVDGKVGPCTNRIDDPSATRLGGGPGAALTQLPTGVPSFMMCSHSFSLDQTNISFPVELLVMHVCFNERVFLQ